MTEKKTFKSVMTKIVNMPEITSIVPFVLTVIIAAILNPIFFKPANLLTMAGSIIGSWGILAVGQAFIIIVGEIDLSMGTTLGLAAILMSWAAVNGLAPAVCVGIAFLLPVLVNLINGLVVTKLKVPVFIATLGMNFICKGLAKVVNYGATIQMYATDYAWTKPFCDALAKGPLGLSWSFWAFLVLLIVGQIILKKTVFGRKVFAVGDNRNVAKVSGIKVDNMKLACFLILGVCVGIASVLWTGYFAGARPDHGTGWEFIAIVSCALGGVSLVGGKGSMLGVLFGVLSMAVIYNLITLLRVNENYQNILIGLFLAASVILDVIRREKTIGKNI